MVRRILAGTAIAALLALPVVTLPIAVWAADPMAPGESPAGQHGALSTGLNASDIIGKKAYGSNGERIGSINDLLVDANGKVTAAVVDVGGFLGMGEHTVAISWDQMKINPSNERVTVSLNKDQLKAAPEYKKSAQINIPNSGEQSSQTPQGSSSGGQ